MAKKLEEPIDAIKHRRIDLACEEVDHDDPRDNNPHRPRLSVWASVEEGETVVTVCIDSMWGQPTRFLELSLDQAHDFAEMLQETASNIEAAAEEAAAS